MNQRKIAMQITRKGYGIHPERDLVLVSPNLATNDQYRDAITAVVIRYIEADFVVIADSHGSVSGIEDNLYLLNDLAEQEVAFLKDRAVLIADDFLSPQAFVKAVETALVKEGYTRTGTTLLAISDDDTTEKLDRHCTPFL